MTKQTQGASPPSYVEIKRDEFEYWIGYIKKEMGHKNKQYSKRTVTSREGNKTIYTTYINGQPLLQKVNYTHTNFRNQQYYKNEDLVGEPYYDEFGNFTY